MKDIADGIQRRIERISSIREQRSILLIEEREISTPLSDNIDIVDIVYDTYQTMLENGEASAKSDSIKRMVVIFVVLYILSPMTLTGSKMTRVGLRRKLSSIYECSDTLISKNTRSVFFFFKYYRIFREEVTKLFLKVEEKLK